MKSKVQRQEDALGVIIIKNVGQNNSIWIILKNKLFLGYFLPSHCWFKFQTHFSEWSIQHWKVLANSPLVMVRTTPSQLALKMSWTMRGQLAPTLLLGREKSPPRQYPMKGQVMDRLDTFATIWTTWLRQQYELGHRPSTETSPWMTIWTFFAWKLAGM